MMEQAWPCAGVRREKWGEGVGRSKKGMARRYPRPVMLLFLYLNNLKFIVTFWLLFLQRLLQIFITSYRYYWKMSSSIAFLNFKKFSFFYNVRFTKAQPSSSQASVAPYCLRNSELSYSYISACLFNFISLPLLPYICFYQNRLLIPLTQPQHWHHYTVFAKRMF